MSARGPGPLAMSTTPSPATGLPTAPSGEPIGSLGELLVHALELEHAGSEHFTLLADTMTIHHNVAVAELFRELAAHARERAAALARHAEGVVLPRIAPWSFKWDCPGQPHGADCLGVELSYRMAPIDALRATIYNQTRGHVFFAHVAATSPDPAAAELAAELAAEQVRHLDALRLRLAFELQHDRSPPVDLDPPHLPE